jgi:hypothetical protein
MNLASYLYPKPAQNSCSLFDTHDPKDDKLIEAFDQIIRPQGPGAINFGTAGQTSTWHSASAFRPHGLQPSGQTYRW